MSKKGKKTPINIGDCRFKRSEETRKLLSATLKRLVKTMDYNSIGVSQIMKESGMSRNNFYYHFSSKEALVSYILETDFKKEVEKAHDYDIGWDTLVIFSRAFYANRVFYKAITTSDIMNPATRKIQALISPLLIEATSNIFQIPKERNSYCTLAADSFIAAILRWIESDNPETPYNFLRKFKERAIYLAESCLISLTPTVPLWKSDIADTEKSLYNPES